MRNYAVAVALSVAAFACSGSSASATSGGDDAPDGSSSSSDEDGGAVESGSRQGDGGAAIVDAAAADAVADASAPPPLGASVSGTINGNPFAAVDTFTDIVSYMTQGVDQVHNEMAVEIVDYPNACAIDRLPAEKGGSNELQIVFDLTNVNHPETPPPIAPGTYPYDVNAVNDPVPDADGNAMDLSVVFDSTDAQCELPNGNDFAQTGTVTITAITSQSVIGSFDLVFTNGDHLTGTFNSPVCVTQADADAGAVTCQ